VRIHNRSTGLLLGALLVLALAAGPAPAEARSRLPDDETLDGNQDGKWDEGAWGNEYPNLWYLKRIGADRAWRKSEGDGIVMR